MAPCEWPDRNFESEADIMVSSVPVYYDPNNKIYYYIFQDRFPDGIHYASENKRAISLANGTLSERILAYKNTYDEDRSDSFAVITCEDADGNEIVGFTITGGGYNLNQMRIGGTDVLADSEKPIIQCKSTDVKKRCIAWCKTVGRLHHRSTQIIWDLIKKVEIIIDGTGSASVSFTGGETDVSYTGTISTPISVKIA